MVEESPYSAVLRDLRAKRDKIDALIKSLEEVSAGGMVSSQEIMAAANGDQTFDTLMNSVKPGEFHGKSFPAAAHAILSKTDRHPLNTNQILEIIEKSGRKVEGKNPTGTIYSSLARNSDFVKVKSNTWGLTEWYPGSKKSSGKAKAVGTEVGTEEIQQQKNEDEGNNNL